MTDFITVEPGGADGTADVHVRGSRLHGDRMAAAVASVQTCPGGYALFASITRKQEVVVLRADAASASPLATLEPLGVETYQVCVRATAAWCCCCRFCHSYCCCLLLLLPLLLLLLLLPAAAAAAFSAPAAVAAVAAAATVTAVEAAVLRRLFVGLAPGNQMHFLLDARIATGSFSDRGRDNAHSFGLNGRPRSAH